MAIYRTNKNNDKFTSISNALINDRRLSSKAIGLMGYLLSNNDDYKLNIRDIERHSKDKRTAIKNTINELIKFGYIVKEGNEYIIYETPVNKKGGENDGNI